MKNRSVSNLSGGGGSPEQSQRVVFGCQLDENYSQTSARRTKPRFWPQARALAFNAKGEKPAGFTMAEILLSLTIIGVVAAVTLPSLTGNINERTWNTQRKALYARFSQAIALMPALNGYGTFTEDESGSITEDNVTETFITAGLSKVLKINNICDADHLADCGITSKFVDLDNNTVASFPGKLVEFNSAIDGTISEGNGHTYTVSNKNTKAAAFETANGESILVYYNPNCKAPGSDGSGSAWYYAQNRVCANFIYDLNGTKGPNTVGKDIGFITALHPSDAIVVAPMPVTKNHIKGSQQPDGGKVCSAIDSDIRMPNQYELSAMFYNRLLLGSITGYYWSSSLEFYNGRTTAYLFSLNIGYSTLQHERTENAQIWCIKR